MQLRLYCLFDRVAEESPEPFAVKSDAVAIRAARFGIMKSQSRADEHRLFFIGTFDTETSVIVPQVPRAEVVIPELVPGGLARKEETLQ